MGIQHKSSWDYIKEEEVNSIPNVTMNDCDKFWEDVRRSSQKIAIGVRAKAEEIDDKYGVVDKVTGAAVAIGGIQLATGHAKSGVLTLAGAALMAAFGEKLKKDREDEKELHLY